MKINTHCPNCGQELAGEVMPSSDEVFDEFIGWLLFIVLWSFVGFVVYDWLVGE